MDDLVIGHELADGGHEAGADEHGGSAAVKGNLLAEPDPGREAPPKIGERCGDHGHASRPTLQDEHLGIEPMRQLPPHRYV